MASPSFQLFKAIVLLGTIAAALLLTAGVWAGYDASLRFLAGVAGQGDKAEKIAVLVTPGKFRFFLFLTAMAVPGFIWMLYKADYFAARFFTAAHIIRSGLINVFRAFWRSKAWYLLLIPLLSSVYYAIVLPVNYDEAWTYLNFTVKSPLASLAYYPVPNNHILHSLITNFTKYIPGLSPLFQLRFSSILVNVCIWILAFALVKRLWNEKTAMVVAGISAMLFMSVYYSGMSRGYALVVLFFVGALYAVFLLLQNGYRLRYLAVFGLCSILGFFTMPSFLYPFLTLNLLLLWNAPGQIARQFWVNVIVGLSVGLLYLPVIVVNGLSALTSNPFVKPINREEVLARLPGFSAQTLSEIFGVHYMYVLPLIAWSLLMILRHKDKLHTSFAFLFLVMPFVLLIGHSVIPFPRTFVYYGFTLTLLIAMPWSRQIQKIKAAHLIPALLCIQVLLLINFHRHIAAYEQYNTTFYEINRQIAGNRSYYFNSRIFDTNLAFELKRKGYAMTKHQRNFPPLYMSADSISGFDYIIIDKEFDQTQVKKPKWSDAYVNVYE